MTKKNIRPQQVAPVERETISTAKDQSGQVQALQLAVFTKAGLTMFL
jgi:prenylated cyclic peptide (anacyclamide/piricyclamide family)